jgi:electron transfer flavoprotein alpha subunit
MENEVWVYVEHSKGEVSEPSLKCICEGRRLAKNWGKELACVIITPVHEDFAATLNGYGVDKVYLVQEKSLEKYSPDTYSSALAVLARMYLPALILFAVTSNGSDLAPRVAAKLKTGLIANCIDFEIDGDGKLSARKPFYNGKVHATVTWNKSPFIATVDTSSLTIEKAKEPKNTKVIAVELKETFEDKTKVIDYIKADPRKVGVNEAEIVIAVGRGLGEARFLKIIQELADVLGATIGGTRPAVDEGWIPEERKIGSSGKEISPILHIACGISGASHYMAGVRNSKFTIVINKDSGAPIFKIADLGVVGNLHEVVPALTKKLRESKCKIKTL